MKYLRSRKRRFCYLVLLIVVALAWPFLSCLNLDALDAKEFFLYVAGLVAPASLLFCIRNRIVSVFKRFSNILFCKWLRGVAISFIATWILYRLLCVIGSIMHGNIWQLFHVYFSFLPVLGAYLFSIKKRIVPALMMVAVLLSNWNPLSGIILSICISVAVIPNKYPLSIAELMTSTSLSEGEESDCLYFFVHTCRKSKVIPALESYVAKSNSFYGHHYLLHISHNQESNDIFYRRVAMAEESLNLSEMQILFPMPRFRAPNEEE